MKIVHLITDISNGGAGIAAMRLHEALKKSGQESEILTLSKNKDCTQLKGPFQNLKNKFNFIAERLIIAPFFNKEYNIFAFSLAKFGNDISSHPIIIKADIVHIHWINFGFLALKNIEELYQINKKIIWTFHDMWTFTGACHYSYDCTGYHSNCENCPQLNSDPFNFTLNSLKQKNTFLPEVNGICPSRWMLSESLKSPKIDSNKIINIGNCIDTEEFKPQDKTIAKKNLGLDINKKYILFGANNINDSRKGLKYLLEAINKINIENTEIISFGKSKENIPGIKSFGKIENIDQLISLYQAASVFVAPSLYDNLPNVILEAMSCGTPCVSFNIGGFPDMIKHKENGYLAIPKSSDDLANGIQFCLENDYLSQNARNFILENFSQNIIAQKHIEFYKKVCLLPETEL